MISPSTDPIGVDIIESLAEAGFDYVELSLRDLVKLEEGRFSALARRVEGSGIRVEACNNFFPAEIPLTGPGARLDAALDYAAAAMERAARLGVRVIVFGSSEARNIPQGFSRSEAWNQLVDLLRNMGPLADRCGLAVAVEPLNTRESNILNLASEALRMIREVNDPRIKLLVDFYHMGMENEDPGIMIEAGAAVGHVHFAKVRGRVFPDEADEASLRFFSLLKRIGYSGRCSVEATTMSFDFDSRRALRLLKEMAG